MGDAFSVPFILSWCEMETKPFFIEKKEMWYISKRGCHGNVKVEMQRLQRLIFFQMKFKIWWS